MSSPPLTIRVKCTTSNKSFPLTLSPTATIASLKQSVKQELGPEAKDRYLRLISSGKLLSPDSELVDMFKLPEGAFVHAVLASQTTSPGLQALAATSGTVAFTLPPQGGEDESDDDIEGGVGRRGFDSLRSRLSRAEVNAVRGYFRVQVEEYGRENAGGGEGGGETDEERRFRWEEEWMEIQGPASEYAVNVGGRGSYFGAGGTPRNTNTALEAWDSDRTGGVGSVAVGSQRDFVWGFILGFFVGFFLLFWIWMPSVTHKQKLGILCGIATQMCFNLASREAMREVQGGV